jgi:hypothetical protein
VKSEGPKFSKGDLVRFKSDYAIGGTDGLGIIIADPLLVFKHDWSKDYGFKNNIWSYDVRIGDSIYKMIPEDFLCALNEKGKDD